MLPVSAINALTARWVSALPTEALEGGTALSGVGVWPLLAILSDAARGHARAELAGAVGIAPEDGTRSGTDVIEWLEGAPGLAAAIGVWHHTAVPINDTWRDSLAVGIVRVFSGDVVKDQVVVDEWAADRTGGRIAKMPVEISSETRLILASALAISATWSVPFINGDEGWLHRMTDDQSIIRYTDDVTCVRVDGDNDIDVTLVLGAIGAAPGTVLGAAFDVLDGSAASRSGMDAADGHTGPGVSVRSYPSSESGRKCVIDLPAFTVAADHDLLSVGDALGLVTVCDRTRGHLPGISSVRLYVESARQDLSVQFSAGGFDAVAITGLEQWIGGVSASPNTISVVSVRFDREFGFVARNRVSGLILAVGWVPASVRHGR